MTLLSFQLDAIDDFYTDSAPALATGATVWFKVRGAWHDGVVVESESYADCTNPYVTIREAGFKPATYHIAVADTYDLDEVLDRDPEYADWLTALERADEEWENRS